MSISINGSCAVPFEAMRQAFEKNFADHGDVGASLSVFHKGEQVVNLWGGSRDKAQQIAWQQDTCVNIFSAGKAFVAICILKLAEQGKLELDSPVAKYWPQFSDARVTVRQVMCHRSGINAFKEKVDDNIIYDWQRVTAAVAAQTPWWEPGEEQGYSPMIFGWLLGEVARRVMGLESFNDVFQALIAQPLGLKAWFGIPDDELKGIADVVGQGGQHVDPAEIKMIEVFKKDPGGVAQMAFTNPMSIMLGSNTPAWRQSQIPGGNGTSNAESLARFYNALISSEALLTEGSRKWLWESQSRSENDNVLAYPLGFSLGFMLSDENSPRCRFGRGARGFGHPGAGGCLGFADPDNDIAFAYTTRSMGQSILLDPRAIRLIDALYDLV